MEKGKSVSEYISGTIQWENELILLREIILSSELQESVKWGRPAYSINGENVLGMSAFKNYVAIWFHQGVFLKDSSQFLINAQEGTTKGLRQWRFSEYADIVAKSEIISDYIEEAIANQKAGKKIKIEKNKTILASEWIENYLKNNKSFKMAFEQLSLTKKREYHEYVREAKKTETKQRRLDKIIPMILKGIGLNDKYKN